MIDLIPDSATEIFLVMRHEHVIPRHSIRGGDGHLQFVEFRVAILGRQEAGFPHDAALVEEFPEFGRAQSCDLRGPVEANPLRSILLHGQFGPESGFRTQQGPDGVLEDGRVVLVRPGLAEEFDVLFHFTHGHSLDGESLKPASGILGIQMEQRRD